MSPASLVEFVAMRNGTHDMIYKTYDLSHQSTRYRTRRALYRLGYMGDEMSMELSKLRNDLSLHVRSPADIWALGELLNEWYVWDRIRTGELRRWKYLAGTRGKNVQLAISKSGIVTVR